MSSGRNRNRKNITWTDSMLNDLKSCKEEALRQKASEDAPRKPSGLKVGYMEIMHTIWTEKGYGHLGLSSQNLVDIINQNNRKIANVASQVAVTIATEITTSETLQVNDEVWNVENAEVNTASVTFDDALIKKLIDEAVVLYESFINNCDDMSNRLYKTKFKGTPASKTVDYINEVCRLLMIRYNIEQCTDYVKSLWTLNTIVYSSIASWISVNNIRGMKPFNGKNDRKLVSKAIRTIDEEIKLTRAFLSKCVAEKQRLSSKGRLTRRTRRNRIEISKHCDVISIYSLTCLIANRKKRLMYLAKRRKRKLKGEAAKRINTEFTVNQSLVFRKFSDAIEEDPENMKPVYKEKKDGGERKYFENVDDVEAFWRTLWEAEDKGNPEAEWLNEFREIFKQMVPDLQVSVEFTEKDCFDSIRKKKNWSSPGPDKIVNFWWKNLRSVRAIIHKIFFHVINFEILVERWFCRGRTGLIPKEGEWAISNQRPITCLNNMYKWLTAVIKMIVDRHLERYKLMQTDQRGASSGVSGTVDNLMVDDMVQRDAILHKRNLFTTWIDVRKAFDSVSHSFLIEILKIHRLPTCIVTAVTNIINLWNIVLIIPLKEGPAESSLIELKNGELQGDTFCPNLYTLCNNLVSWIIRSFKGYVLSAPLKEKVTHSLFIDDLKVYSNSIRAAKDALNVIKTCMSDCGLEWNNKKTKGCFLKAGKFCECDELLLDDGTKVKCLKEGETYKFMGIHQSTKLAKDELELSLTTAVKQRAHVIWSSGLHDWNKVLATNMFVNGCMEYYFWGCNLRIDFLKEVDRSIRKVMNICGAKHTNTVNDGLYLSRQKGGRGLKSVEASYKDTKIKAAMKLKQNEDPRMKLVNRYFQIHLETSSYSIFKEAEKYCSEKDLTFECILESITIGFPGEEISTNDEKCSDKISRKLKTQRTNRCLQQVMACNWQGVILKSIMEDESLVKGNFYWLCNWRWCPTSTISEIMLLLYQTLDTKCYRKHLGTTPPVNDTICRLCRKGQESVKHLLSNCGELVKKVYKDRHDKALKCFFFQVLAKLEFFKDAPQWFSPEKVKPMYTDENYEVSWDVPEYSGRDGETIDDGARPDGKIVMHREKKIFLIEQTVPWNEIRDDKYEFKRTKYTEIQTFLKMENPDYEIDQITLVMDVFGGYSKNLRENIIKVLKNKTDIDQVIRGMQKSIISSEANLTRVFKMRTKFCSL